MQCKRFVVVLVAYTLSLPGIFFSLTIVREDLMSLRSLSLRPSFIWPVAWLFHMMLSAAWVSDKHMHSAWSAVAVLTGFCALLTAGILLPVAVLFTAPAGVLAIWLLLFQARAIEQPKS